MLPDDMRDTIIANAMGTNLAGCKRAALLFKVDRMWARMLKLANAMSMAQIQYYIRLDKKEILERAAAKRDSELVHHLTTIVKLVNGADAPLELDPCVVSNPATNYWIAALHVLAAARCAPARCKAAKPN
eukprot:5915162-Pleurochrysis_carterae.AAC.1